VPSEIFQFFLESLARLTSVQTGIDDYPVRKIPPALTEVTVSSALSYLPDEEKIRKIRDFFREKFSESPVDLQNLKEYMRLMPKVSPPEAEDLAKEFSADELLKAIEALATGVVSGTDGLTSEFFRTFSTQLVPILLWVWIESLSCGQLPLSMRTAVSSLIYKKGDPTDLRNYRTISIANSDYKIISIALMQRVLKVLDPIIGAYETSENLGKVNLRQFDLPPGRI
jgi:hypothetical protein